MLSGNKARNYIISLRIIIIGILLCWNTVLYSQLNNDSIKELPVVDIFASRLQDYTVGLNHEDIDSITFDYYRSSSLAGILGDLTSIYVKSYGAGSLSTLALRGTAANHSGVYWNGFNMNPANLGMSDLSLYPLAFFESVEIQYGGASSLFGSGNIGGGIHLKNSPEFRKINHLDIELAYGSFEEKKAVAKAVFANKKWYSKTVVVGTNIKNDFPYTDYAEAVPTEEKQQNAQMTQYGIMQDFHRKLSSDQYLYLGLWYQNTNRHIPATLTMAESNAWQVDRAFRSSLRYARYFRKGILNIKSAYFNDFEHFVDENSKVDSEIRVSTIFTEIEGRREITNSLSLNGGISYSLINADIEAYKGKKHQNSLALYMKLIQDLKFIPWMINVNLRQELVEGYTIPFTPSLGFEGKIWKKLFGKVNVSYNYRIPSLNERFWDFGYGRGNEDLEPEKSLNEELSLIVKTTSKNEILQTDIGITLYNASITNWIQWVPSGNGVWSPQNIMNVRSRGVECRTKFGYMSENINANINFGYTYTKSTNETDSESTNEKQLVYVPLHKVSGQLGVQTKYISFMYSQSYTGIRYTLSDNSENLPENTLANFNVSRVFKIKKVRLGLQFDVLNIWNADYQSISYRPMPGRSYRFSIRFMYN